jgi:3-deoxy-D-manno-octulosonate 8-phosphate phosphatase (KDO 8-P phosphatase)
MVYMDSAKTIVIDCDGVLTDGKQYIDHTGEKMFKAFHSRDVRAIRELISHGYEVVIVTADDWPGSKFFASKTGASIMILRDKSKIPYENFIAVGDDAWDVPMLKKAEHAFAPCDADASVKNLLNVHTLYSKGGEGVIAELVNILVP